jgi:hypothetical protein
MNSSEQPSNEPVNDESNGFRTDQERLREQRRLAGIKSGEARRRKAEKRRREELDEEGELDVDAEIERLGMYAWTQKQLIRVASNTTNAAASVAASKELRSREAEGGTEASFLQQVAEARAELEADRLHLLCPACRERAEDLERVIQKRQERQRCPGCGGEREGGAGVGGGGASGLEPLHTHPGGHTTSSMPP